MGHIQQYVIVYKGKDHRSFLKFIGVISLMFIWIVLLITYTFSFFDSISKQQISFELGYPSEDQQIQANNGILEQRREKTLIHPSEVRDGLSAQERNVLSTYVLFGKALKGFQRDGGKNKVKNR